MRWVHSIMPSKSGRTNGWVFDLCRLSPETFGHSVYWQLLHTQFCYFTVFTGATFLLLSSKGLFVTLTRPGWGSGPRRFMPACNVLVLTTGWCDVARSWRYLAFERAPTAKTEGWNWVLLHLCSLLPPLARKKWCGWGCAGSIPLYFQPLASVN